MKKILILILSLISTCSFSDYIYCAQTIICAQGTCQMNPPNEYFKYFIQPYSDGTYNFDRASFANGSAICLYGQNYPGIQFYNNGQLQPVFPNWVCDGDGNSMYCPFEPIIK